MEMGDQLVTHPGAGLGVALQCQVDLWGTALIEMSEADGGSVRSCEGGAGWNSGWQQYDCYNSLFGLVVSCGSTEVQCIRM